MHVTMTESGATVDAVDLGPLLGIAAKDVQTYMRNGDITSQFETGEGDDAGRFRLTFWYAGQRVRLTCDAGGTVLSTSRIPTGR